MNFNIANESNKIGLNFTTKKNLNKIYLEQIIDLTKILVQQNNFCRTINHLQNIIDSKK